MPFSSQGSTRLPEDMDVMETIDDEQKILDEVADEEGAEMNIEEANPYEAKQRKNKFVVWNHMERLPDHPTTKQVRVQCKHCKFVFQQAKTIPTTTLIRHLDTKCLRVQGGLAGPQQQVLQFSSSDASGSSTSIGTFIYDHALMRKKVSHYLLVEELPFLHVESFMFNEMMRTATPYWQKISRTTAKNDVVATYELEKKKLFELLALVDRINITTDMWTCSNKRIGYMVVTAHWIDANWKLNMRVLNFFNVPPPHSGVVIANALSDCFREWNIIDKIGTITVDNAKENDVALRILKDNFVLSKTLSVDGKLFHMRCCAHILNLLVQDGLKPVESIVDCVRDGIKYVISSEGRRRKFSEIARHLKLEQKTLILDVPTRWNSTHKMLKIAIIFKEVFSRYQERDPGFVYVPSMEDWKRIEFVNSFLEILSDCTDIVSESQYPTTSLFLSEVWRVKDIIDEKLIDSNDYIIDMARMMSTKFNKFWGECNLLMSIAAVLDPRFKLSLPEWVFRQVHLAEDAERYILEVRKVLNELFEEYVKTSTSPNQGHSCQTGTSSISIGQSMPQNKLGSGRSKFKSAMNQFEILQPTKTELEIYLEDCRIRDDGTVQFDALEWWRSMSEKYRILSKMARDILVIPITTVASESTFSAGGRVVDPYHASLLPETVQMLLCGADWIRNFYGLKRGQIKMGKAQESEQEYELPDA